MKERDKMLRRIYNLPFSEKFIELKLPFLITFSLTYLSFVGISYLPIKQWVGMDIGLTLILSIPIASLIYYIQNRFYHYAFTDTLADFISITKNNHAVTQMFASQLLQKFLTGDPSVISFFHSNNKTLKKITLAIENKEGVIMDESMYTTILTNSVRYQPNAVLAVWNTDKFPLANAKEEYAHYFNVLDDLYQDIKNDQKVRIMIFSDESAYKDAITTNIWSYIINEHNRWYFQRIYYCYSSQYETIRKQVYGSQSNINDFVLFKRKNKSEWIISRDDEQKVFLYKDRDDIDTLNSFYRCLKDYCDKQEQFIILTAS